MEASESGRCREASELRSSTQPPLLLPVRLPSPQLFLLLAPLVLRWLPLRMVLSCAVHWPFFNPPRWWLEDDAMATQMVAK